MDENKLSEIKSFEVKAAELIEESRKKAQTMLSGAEEEGLALFDQQKRAVREEARAMVENMKKEGSLEAEKTLSGLKAELEALDNKAAAAREKAVAAVKKALLG